MSAKLDHIHICERYDDNVADVRITPSQHATWPARMATVMAEKWGMVAAQPDGQDTSGRQKMALLTPAEVVERACTTTELLIAEMTRRGWVQDVPSIEEAATVLDARKGAQP